jgi:hypothetical protein
LAALNPLCKYRVSSGFTKKTSRPIDVDVRYVSNGWRKGSICLKRTMSLNNLLLGSSSLQPHKCPPRPTDLYLGTLKSRIRTLSACLHGSPHLQPFLKIAVFLVLSSQVLHQLMMIADNAVLFVVRGNRGKTQFLKLCKHSILRFLRSFGDAANAIMATTTATKTLTNPMMASSDRSGVGRLIGAAKTGDTKPNRLSCSADEIMLARLNELGQGCDEERTVCIYSNVVKKSTQATTIIREEAQ